MGDPECSVPWCHNVASIKIEVPVWEDPHRWGAMLGWVGFCTLHGEVD